jgi:adenine-specific DNA methylase
MSHIERHQQNLAVLSQLKNGTCSTDLLKSYSGWGGLREAVYTPEIYREMRKILTPDEIISLKKTLNSAYYTPKEMVAFMYDFLAAEGFIGGNILEPSIGNGVFIEHMPKAFRQSCKITGVEIDHVTARICKSLYPDVNLHTLGFEEFQPIQRYDLIIGNPPYGAQTLSDKNYADLKDYCIHHYFVAKSMRLLKQGGILAMVLPAYFMDNESKHVRNIIDAEGGELVAAYRLPDDLFADAKVTVDIVFLRKGKTEKSPAWLKVSKKTVSGHSMFLNEYYHQHPTHIIGQLAVVNMYNRKGLTCKKDCANPFEKLARFIEDKSKTSTKKSYLGELKEQVNMLCQELNSLSLALASISQTITNINHKIAMLGDKI